MKNPYISIVIPTYNDDELLKECLQSIQLQSYNNFEVIVVDNNSSVDITELVGSFGKKYTLIHEKKQGIVYARNAGFNKSRGSLIARLDADSRLPSDWLERLFEFSKNQNDVRWAVTGPGDFYNAKFKRFHSGIHSAVYYYVNRFLLGHYLLWGSNMAITKEAWLDVKDKVCLTNSIHEDMDLSSHLYMEKIPIFYHKTLKASMKLKRMDSSPRILWKYLYKWAHSLSRHNKIAGLLCYPLAGMVFIFGITVGVLLVWAESENHINRLS